MSHITPRCLHDLQRLNDRYATTTRESEPDPMPPRPQVMWAEMKDRPGVLFELSDTDFNPSIHRRIG